MKKKSLFLSIAATCISMGALAGCDLGLVDNSSSSATVNVVSVNNLANYYLPTDTINWDNVSLTLSLSKGSDVTLTKGEFDTDNPSSSAQFVLYTDGLYELSTSGLASIPEDRYNISYSLTYNDIKYEGDLFSISITQYPNDLYRVMEFSEPEFVTTYKDNVTNRVNSSDSAEDSFYEECEYTVGDDNPFKFKPGLILLDLEDLDFENLGNLIVIQPSTYAVDVKVYLGDTSLNLEGNKYVEYSDFEFDFTQEAVGKTFTIEFSLKFFDTDINNNPIEPITFTFNVEDGYNAYTGLDLGVMNLHSDTCQVSSYEYANGSGASAGNHKAFWDEETQEHVNKNYHDIWTEFYKEIAVDDATYSDVSYTKGIYMHNDIKLSMDDFPSDYKISEAEAQTNGGLGNDALLVGSLRDETFIYNHLMEDDFTFNGNLFTLDCSDIRWGRTLVNGQNFTYFGSSTENTDQGNSRLFTFDGDRRRTDAEAETAHLINLNAVGNLDLEETGDNFPIREAEAELNASSLRSGSIWLMDSVGTHTEVDNVIAKEFLLGFYAEKSKAGYNCLEIDHTKLFDCYSAGLFTWCSAENVARNSVFKRFGAPVVMAMSAIDYTKYGDGTDSSIGYAEGYQMSGFTLEESVIVDNYLKGDEYFFQAYGLEQVIPFIQGIDGVFHNGDITSLLTMVLESLGYDSSIVNIIALLTTVTDYKKTFMVDTVDTEGTTTPSFNLLYAGMDRNVFGYNSDLFLDFGYAGSNIHIDSDYDKENEEEANTDNLAYVIDQFYDTTNSNNGGLSYNGLLPLFITNTGKVFTIGLELTTFIVIPTLTIYLYDVIAALNDDTDTDPSPFTGSYNETYNGTDINLDFGTHATHKLEALSEEDTELMLFYDAGSLLGESNSLRIAVGLELFDCE